MIFDVLIYQRKNFWKKASRDALKTSRSENCAKFPEESVVESAFSEYSGLTHFIAQCCIS